MDPVREALSLMAVEVVRMALKGPVHLGERGGGCFPKTESSVEKGRGQDKAEANGCDGVPKESVKKA